MVHRKKKVKRCERFKRQKNQENQSPTLGNVNVPKKKSTSAAESKQLLEEGAYWAMKMREDLGQTWTLRNLNRCGLCHKHDHDIPKQITSDIFTLIKHGVRIR